MNVELGTDSKYCYVSAKRIGSYHQCCFNKLEEGYDSLIRLTLSNDMFNTVSRIAGLSNDLPATNASLVGESRRLIVGGSGWSRSENIAKGKCMKQETVRKHTTRALR
jgi:hypothetical protein